MPRAAALHKDIPAIDADAFRSEMLGWYDRHARVLPWRARPGFTANPYHVWLSEVMLQQTTVQAVIPYFVKFVDKWPRVQDLAAAPAEDVMAAWAGLGYYARARNLHKCAKAVAADHGGVFPRDYDGLKQLPGIGDYTAAAIAAIAFDQPATVIDGNVDRVISRVFAITDPLPGSKPQIRRLAASLSDGRADRPGDFAQAMMDLGATICTPRSPKCDLCPVRNMCAARAQNIAEDLPRKDKKRPQPYKRGYVYWITDVDGANVLLERRPDSGMLGGMTGFPTTPWTETPRTKRAAKPDHAPVPPGCIQTPSRASGVMVRHSFTHFDLDLTGVALRAGADFSPEPGQFWHPLADMDEAGLPTLFKKFVNLCIL